MQVAISAFFLLHILLAGSDCSAFFVTSTCVQDFVPTSLLRLRFAARQQISSSSSSTFRKRQSELPILFGVSAHEEEEEDRFDSDSVILGNNKREDVLSEASFSSPTTATTATETTTAFMVSQEQRRILIEELGFRRTDVEKLRVKLVAPIIAKRLRCPESGMPEAWIDPQSSASMLSKLENESKYPFKVPLLGLSTILAGKGLSDLVVTLIKVKMNFPGASLIESFQGVPILLIDVVCVLLGTGLGIWTWNAMRDK